MQPPRRKLRVGVDVGGTNTDCALLDLTPNTAAYGSVLASCKATTTRDISDGIRAALSKVIGDAEVDLGELEAIAVGTTHFINALVERKQEHLEQVAVVRLCGSFTRGTPPFAGFPLDLRSIVEGAHFFCKGGLQIDGSEIARIDEAEIREVCARIKELNIRSIVVCGVFSPIDSEILQEERVADIIRQALPEASIVLSKRVSNLGLLERENASILNACLLSYAQTIVRELQEAARSLDLQCPVMVTGNDGTLLTCSQAAALPIQTFSSGPTNSMRGAAFCASLATGERIKESALVVDIGGTTTEVGMLLPTGFPRQSGGYMELCGVRLKFAMPQVTSIGLGGGSLVRFEQASGKATVGPDSVGYRLSEEAVVFGGPQLTTTDVAVAYGSAKIGSHQSLASSLGADLVAAVRHRIKRMLEETMDAMKTSSEPIPAYLVGGGAFLAPEELDGISKVIQLPHAGVANAIGAATAQVASTVDIVKDTSKTSIAQELAEIQGQAIQAAIQAGADPDTVTVIERDCLPVAYTAGKCRFYVKAAGEWTGALTSHTKEDRPDCSTTNMYTKATSKIRKVPQARRITADFISTYTPQIVNRRWRLSEVDLEWIADGCYILGCGGGGAPTHTFLQCREIVRAGHTIEVVDIGDLPDNGLVGWGGGLGSPEVASERMLGTEYDEALAELKDYLKLDKYTALAALEIGGSNGMINLVAGSSKHACIPIADVDFMGRAYPTGHQVTPNVYDETRSGKNLLPIAMSSGDGNLLFMTRAKSDMHVDPTLRAACVEMGTLVGAAKRPLTVTEVRQFGVKNTVSLAWRIGRAVDLARKRHEIGNVGKIIVDAVGGPETARILFSGKIVDVNRTTYKGHLIGDIVIEAISAAEDGDTSQAERFTGRMRIPFKNENLTCEAIAGDGSVQIVAAVPDLISVIDAANGSALGTPDYRYGLRVVVLGITAAPQWTETARGLELGGPAAFGMPEVPYVPIGRYVKPSSVIDQYS